MTFMSDVKVAMGEFACKMQQAGHEYNVQKLNMMIGSLLKAVRCMN